MTNPLVLGTGIGAGVGTGAGYLTSRDEPEDIRKRHMLVGGLTGAGIGALAGGLAGMGGIHPAEHLKVTEELRTKAHAAGKAEGRLAGIQEGLNTATMKMPETIFENPDLLHQSLDAIGKHKGPEAKVKMVKDILANMADKERDQVVKSFDKGWLSKWLGG